MDDLSHTGQTCGRANRPASVPLRTALCTRGAASRLKRLSINQLTTLRLSFEQDLEMYAAAGIRGIGVSWRKLNMFGARQGTRAVRQSGLMVSSLGWVGGFTGQNGYSYNEALAEAKSAVRIAAQLRAENVVTLTGPQAGHIQSHARRLVVSALRELAYFGESYGVTLSLKAMDPLFRNNWTFINALAEAAELVQQVSHPNVRLAFGCYHHWREDRFLHRVRDLAPLMSLVQLADWKEPKDENDQVLPGEGCIPFGDLLHALDEGGYSRWLELEVWSRDLWKTDSADLIDRCVSRMKAFETLDRLVGQSSHPVSAPASTRDDLVDDPE